MLVEGIKTLEETLNSIPAPTAKDIKLSGLRK